MFRLADSPEEMRRAVAEFPFLKHPGFIAAIEQAVVGRAAPEDVAELERRLFWLREITAGGHTGEE